MNIFLKNIISNMFVTKLISVFRPARTVILMYHDLREDDDFENWLRVSVSDFSYQLTRLQQIGEFISPVDIFRPSIGNRLRFLITFDDGYRNNFELAAPILQRHRIPALFFISTQHMQEQEPFWPDIVITSLQGRQLERLDLRSYNLGIFEFHPVGSTRRWDDIHELLKALKNLGNTSHPTVAAVLQYLQNQYAETLAKHLPRFQPIKADQIKVMSTNPLFYFGSHGHHHDILTYQDDEEVDVNLQMSKLILEEHTGSKITHLAYPNGDNNGRIIERAKMAGFTHGYGIQPGTVDSQSPVMCLPRLGVGGVGSRLLPFYKLNRMLISERLR
jgi:peptidoglycan/xylan/chitin deacetylase (PgdA/CDA1 family)